MTLHKMWRLYLMFILCLVLVEPRKTGNRPNMTKYVDWDVKNQHKI